MYLYRVICAGEKQVGPPVIVDIAGSRLHHYRSIRKVRMLSLLRSPASYLAKCTPPLAGRDQLEKSCGFVWLRTPASRAMQNSNR